MFLCYFENVRFLALKDFGETDKMKESEVSGEWKRGSGKTQILILM